MKKLLLIATVFLVFTTPVLADATAIISRNEPLDNVVLNGSNNYEVKKEFDGTPSSPDDATYSWSWVENSISKSGDKVNFTFDRSAPSGTDQPQTVQLTVSDGGDSNTTSVTQPLRDVPNASISANPSSLDLDNDDTVDFSSTVTNEFNTPDGGIDYNWTINGTQEDTTSNFSKTFSDTGTYTVKLNVTDAKNYSSVTSLDYDVTNSSDSGDNNNNNNNNNNNENSGGGGGGGLSSSGYDFLHTIAGNVTDGENEEIDVNTQAFRKLSFTATENITEPEFGVNVQDDRPSPATTAPNGELYVYMELDEENISSGDVENVEIEFRVDDTWVESRNLSTEDIYLMRYDGGWNQLETTYEEDKNGYMHFTADSPGLSVFAASGFKSNVQVKNISVSKENVQAFESFDIDVTFENTASSSGWKEFNITVGQSSYSTNVSLDPGAEETKSFTESLSGGDYTVEAGTETLGFSVQSSSSSSDDLTTQDETDSGNEDDTNQTSDEEQEVQDSGLPVLPIAAGIGVFIITLGGAAVYLKKDEIEEFMETHEFDPQIELGLPSSSSESEGLQVAEKYSEVKESIEEMGVNDPEIEVKMDHAKMLINQDKKDEAAEVLEEVTDRILDYEEEP